MQKFVVVGVFFIFLTISLFLGDGKQPLVDTFLASGIILAFGLVFYNKTAFRPLPRPVFALWLVLIGYFIVRTIFSESLSYSIFATARLLEAFLVYQLFYSLSSVQVVRVFSNGLRLLAATTTVVAFFLLVFPVFSQVLPLMNLLYSNYGHNHLASLLLFVFPLGLFSLKERRSRLNKMVFLLVVLGLALSFARGAWIVVSIYTAIYFRHNLLAQPRKTVLIAISILMLGWWLWSLRPLAASTWLERQLAKPAFWQDLRLTYWKQALRALVERPLFGSGPGTFYLQSKRLEEAPLSYSWFAHSFPLQAAAELGLVGAMLLFLLLFYHGKAMVKHLQANPDGLWQALFWGLVLVFVYSWFEFNLDFLVIWLLFWAATGLLSATIWGKEKRAVSWQAITLSLLGLTVFYLSSLGSLVADILRNERLALSLAPYSRSLALKYLRTAKPQDLSKDQLYPLVASFNRGDPEVLFAAAVAKKSPELFLQAIQGDPQNFNYHLDYLRFLVTLGSRARAPAIGLELKKLGDTFLSSLHPQLNHLDFTLPLFQSFYTTQNIDVLGNTLVPRLSLAKFYYLLGLDVFGKEPTETEKLWELAAEAAPEWSYYHLELASLEHYILGNNQAALQALSRCDKQRNARAHCAEFGTNSLPPVGSFEKKIRAISAKLL